MRQLRQPARPDRPDQPALADRRLRRPSSARRSTSSSTCRSSPTGCATWIESHDDWRPNVKNFSLGAARRAPAAADHARPRLGRAASRCPGYAEDEHKRIYVWFDAVIGYLSASIEWAAATRRPRRLARVVAEPRGGALLLPGQGQHRLPHRDLAGDAARLRRGRRVRRRPRAARSSRTTSSRPSSSRTTASSSRRAAATRSTCATSSTATTPTRSATTSSPRAPRRRTPTSPGPSSCAATTTSCSRTGATSSTGRSRTPTGTSAPFREPGELTERDEALLATIDAGFDERRRADRAGPLPRRARRGDAALVRGQPVRQRHRRRGRS